MVSGASALDWFDEHPGQFSIFGSSKGQSWQVEADTPRVLASAQKIHVFAALLELARLDPELFQTTVRIEELRRHHLPGTDTGAYERALLAGGISLEADGTRSVTVSQLATQMLYYSSNAAADALADLIQRRDLELMLTSSLPPRMRQQFLVAFDARPDGPRALASAERRGMLTYQNTTRYLSELMTRVLVMREYSPGKDAVRFLPYLAGQGERGIRGKRGQLPGFRAGVLVRRTTDGAPVVGAYAITDESFGVVGDRTSRAVEAAAMGLAAGLIDSPVLQRGAVLEGEVGAWQREIDKA